MYILESDVYHILTLLLPSLSTHTLWVIIPSLNRHFRSPSSDAHLVTGLSTTKDCTFASLPAMKKRCTILHPGPYSSPPWTMCRNITVFLEHLLWATYCSPYPTFIISLILTTAPCGKYSSHFMDEKTRYREISCLPTLIIKLEITAKLSDFMLLTDIPHLNMCGAPTTRFSKWSVIVKIHHSLRSVKFFFM